MDLCAKAYACVYLNSNRGLPRSEVELGGFQLLDLENIPRYPEIQLYSYIHILMVLSYEIGYDPRNRGGEMREGGYTYMTT